MIYVLLIIWCVLWPVFIGWFTSRNKYWEWVWLTKE